MLKFSKIIVKENSEDLRIFHFVEMNVSKLMNYSMDMCVEMAKVLLWYERIPGTQVEASSASFSSLSAGIAILSCKLCINNANRTERMTSPLRVIMYILQFYCQFKK
jgi:hypothetical protein